MIPQRFKDFIKNIYTKLIKIDDTPQKIACGFGLGVFLGILPWLGPVAAFILATIFRCNKLAAVTGSLLTNTWLTLITFVLAGRVGTFVTGEDWQSIYEEVKMLIKNFHWKDIFDSSFFQIAKPFLIGYVIVALIAGIGAYFLSLWLLARRRKKKF